MIPAWAALPVLGALAFVILFSKNMGDVRFIKVPVIIIRRQRMAVQVSQGTKNMIQTMRDNTANTIQQTNVQIDQLEANNDNSQSTVDDLDAMLADMEVV